MAEFREKIRGNFLFVAVLKSAWLERIRAWISSAPQRTLKNPNFFSRISTNKPKALWPPFFLSSMSPESHQLLNFLARECQSATLDGDKANADKFWTLLDKPLRNALQKMFLNYRDQEDLVQVAITAICRNIRRFNSEKASFQTWAKIEARSAMIDYLRATGYPRTMAEHKKLIIEKLQFHFKAGPTVGQSWLDLAKEHQELVVSLTGLSARQVSNALDRWSLAEASNIAAIDFRIKGRSFRTEELDSCLEDDDSSIDEAPLDLKQSRDLREALEVAMSRLESKSRTLLIQKYVARLSHAEIARKYNLSIDNSKQIVSKACKDLRDILERMDQNGL